METRLQKLEILRENLKQRLARYEQHQKRDEALDPDFAEQATQTQNDEVVESLQAEALDQLTRVNHALDRIHRGLGTVCEKCDAVIVEARLNAVPESTVCTDCAQWQEKH